MRRTLFLLALVFSWNAHLLSIDAAAGDECTTAVVSAKGSSDGRPFLWKNRDTRHRNNAVVLLQGPRYRYVAVINVGDTTQAWAGVNEAGFAIMNAEALDVEGDQLDGEGEFMAEALGRCATVDDFERLLLETNRPGRHTKSNFGVVDARGGAAYFETGNHTFARYDADRAEGGWIVRTNFAQTGDGTGGGIFRFVRARQIFRRMAAHGELSPLALLRLAARDLVTPASVVPDAPPGRWVRTRNSINRFRTACCVIVQEPEPGGDPRLATFWIVLGEPLFGAAVPVWVSTGSVPEPLRGPDQPLVNRLIQSLESRAYVAPKRRDLLSLDWLEGPEGRRMVERLEDFERRWFARVDSVLAEMAASGVDIRLLEELQTEAGEELVQLLVELGAKE